MKLLKLEQTAAGLHPAYRLESDIGTLEARLGLSRGGRRVTILKNGEVRFEIYYSAMAQFVTSVSTWWGGRRCKAVVTDLSGQVCGEFSRVNLDGLFAPSCYEIRFGGKCYTGYRIGRGKAGIFLELCLDGQTVAMACKPALVTDLKDTYAAGADSEDPLLAMALFCLYQDLLFNADLGKYASHSKAVTLNYAPKRLAAHFDSAFWEKMRRELSARRFPEVFINGI